MANKKAAVQTLPTTYVLHNTMDLSRQKKLALGLNLAGLGLFLFSFPLITTLIFQIRGLQNHSMVLIDSSTPLWQPILLGILFLCLLLLLHETIHALFFWIYTRSKVKFAVRFTYAYAAAPDWFLLRNPYRLIAIAPLVWITGCGLLGALWVPIPWLMPLLLFLCVNIASSAGDLYLFFRLQALPKSTYIQDQGDRILFYIQTAADASS